jgi:hypothetical protein
MEVNFELMDVDVEGNVRDTELMEVNIERRSLPSSGCSWTSS